MDNPTPPPARSASPLFGQSTSSSSSSSSGTFLGRPVAYRPGLISQIEAAAEHSARAAQTPATTSPSIPVVARPLSSEPSLQDNVEALCDPSATLQARKSSAIAIIDILLEAVEQGHTNTLLEIKNALIPHIHTGDTFSKSLLRGLLVYLKSEGIAVNLDTLLGPQDQDTPEHLLYQLYDTYQNSHDYAEPPNASNLTLEAFSGLIQKYPPEDQHLTLQALTLLIDELPCTDSLALISDIAKSPALTLGANTPPELGITAAHICAQALIDDDSSQPLVLAHAKEGLKAFFDHAPNPSALTELIQQKILSAQHSPLALYALMLTHPRVNDLFWPAPARAFKSEITKLLWSYVNSQDTHLEAKLFIAKILLEHYRTSTPQSPITQQQMQALTDLFWKAINDPNQPPQARLANAKTLLEHYAQLEHLGFIYIQPDRVNVINTIIKLAQKNPELLNDEVVQSLRKSIKDTHFFGRLDLEESRGPKKGTPPDKKRLI